MMQSLRHLGSIVLAGLSFAALIGCGTDNKIATYPVAGMIKYTDGSPLAGGSIVVHCSGGLPTARGVVNEDGSFSLGTYSTDDGAPVGVHPVSIFPALPADFDPDSGRRPPPTIQPKYSRPETSGITIEVNAESENYSEITVERAKR